MRISVYFTLSFLLTAQDFVTCAEVPVDFKTVALGDTVVLNCTYSCSSGFVRGCWTTSEDSGCLGEITKCSVSLLVSNVSAEDLNTTYTCRTIATDDPQLRRKIRRIVSLRLQGQTSVPNWTVTKRTIAKSALLPVQPTKSAEEVELPGIKVLATVTVVVATVLAALAAYLCLKRNRQGWNCKEEHRGSRSGSPLPPQAVHLPVKGPQSTQSDRVTLRIPVPDNESDTEVPYADIMITVRGVSTPELTQVGYLSPGDQKEWWGDDSRPHLQASRSADRLHIPVPREVTRKISTNSEYAVITYA